HGDKQRRTGYQDGVLHAVLRGGKSSFFRYFDQVRQLPERDRDLRAQGVADPLPGEVGADRVSAEGLGLALGSGYGGFMQLPVDILQGGPLRVQALDEAAPWVAHESTHAGEYEPLVGDSAGIEDRLAVGAVLAQPG